MEIKCQYKMGSVIFLQSAFPDLLLVGGGKVWMHREAEDTRGDIFASGEITCFITQISKGRLKVKG